MAIFDSIQKAMSINDIASKLFSLPVKVQFCHHNTHSFSAHKALDKSYDSLNDLKDEIIEKIIGYSGTRYTELVIPKYSKYTEAMNKEVAKDIMDFGKQLEEWAEKQEFCDIENLAQSYSGVGAQLNYLLTLT
jgi:DNA-binding ferritin-like protein